MANRPAMVTQAEVKRSVEGVKAAGVIIGRVEVEHRTGKVIVWVQGASDDSANPCDRLLK